MKKLIALLNEYQESRSSKFRFLCYDINSSSFIIEKNPRMVLGEETIINKKFWFIEWLVIYGKVKYWPIEELTILDNDWKIYWYTDTLLMHLAIQDDPIEFLFSILK